MAKKAAAKRTEVVQMKHVEFKLPGLMDLFRDYNISSIERAFDNLDAIKTGIQKVIKDNPECTDWAFQTYTARGYYDDQWKEANLTASRPINEQDRAEEAAAQKRTEEWQRQQYEILKKKFDSK